MSSPCMANFLSLSLSLSLSLIFFPPNESRNINIFVNETSFDIKYSLHWNFYALSDIYSRISSLFSSQTKSVIFSKVYFNLAVLFLRSPSDKFKEQFKVQFKITRNNIIFRESVMVRICIDTLWTIVSNIILAVYVMCKCVRKQYFDGGRITFYVGQECS